MSNLNPQQFAPFDRKVNGIPGQIDAYPTKRGFRGKIVSDNDSANRRVTFSAPARSTNADAYTGNRRLQN